LLSPQSYAMTPVTSKQTNPMAQRCAICGKGPQYGHNVSHSKVHTKRRFMPNLHKARVTIDGRSQTALVCTRCLRTQAKSVYDPGDQTDASSATAPTWPL